jgi:hypothetical protein
VRSGLEHDPLVLAEREVDVHGQIVQVPERRHRSGPRSVGERRGELRLGRQPDILPDDLATLPTSTADGAGSTSITRFPFVVAITTLANLRPGTCSVAAIFCAV